MNEIHARFCSAHAAPRSRPADRYDAERFRHEPFGLHEVAAEEMRHAELAQHVGAARVVAELAPAARAPRRTSRRRRRTRRPRSPPSPSSVSASACGRSSPASVASVEHGEQVVARGVDARAAAPRPCPARAARASAAGSGSGGEQAERAVVVAAEQRPTTRPRSARSAARIERGDGLLAHVGGNAGDRAELADELGRGREVMRDLVDRRLAARFEHRRDARVAAGPLGLGERAVRDLVDELGLEVEVVVVELDEVAFGEPVEQRRRVGAVGERERPRAIGPLAPTTAQSSSSERSAGSSASSRAASRPCSVAGTSRMRGRCRPTPA